MADQRGVDYKGYTQLRYIGITWVLFVGIIFGHFGLTIDTNLLHFLKEFGLVLFVYSIGLQVGPGFFSSFRSGGLRLNFLASLVIMTGVGVTLLLFWITGTPITTMVGVMSGAVTNTPGLGAAHRSDFLPTFCSQTLLFHKKVGRKQ